MVNRYRLAFASLLTLGLMLAGKPAHVQGQPPSPKPTKEHALLKKNEGTWDATIKDLSDPSKPKVTKGVEVNKMTCGGLWLLSEFTGKMGDETFTGVGTMGYDPDKKKFVGTWVDSMQTYVGLTEGTLSDDGKTMTSWMEGKDPSGNPMKLKMVTKYKSDNEHTFTMILPLPGGKEMPMMEIEYKRKK